MNRPVTFDQGPYLLAAFLCERVLNETDGVQSIVRIVDRVTHSPVVDSPTEQMQPFSYALTLFVLLKAGIASGSYNLRITLIKPSGDSPEPHNQTIYFEGDEDRGVSLALLMPTKFDMQGIYWLEIHLDEVRLTRIPLRVIYMPKIRPRRSQH